MKEMNKKKIILTGGGTAGHVWPLVSVYQKMKNDYEVLYLGSGEKKEKEIVERAGIKYKKILSGKFRRYFSLLNFIDPIKVIIGIIQAKWHILRFWPDVIFAKGGYVTVPVGIAGFILGRKLIIHESDSVMGLSNKILSKFSKKIFCAFPIENYPEKIRHKILWTGVPVRPEILTGDRGKAKDIFGFTRDLPTVLFIGGSSGAAGINKMVKEKIDKLLEFCQVIHITGKSDYQKIRKRSLELPQDLQKRFRYFDFVTRELPEIFALSDLIISRAGATTLFELASQGKPVIFIPYPDAASNHQYLNAKILERNQAAILMEEGKTTSEQLVAQIKRLLDNNRAMENLSTNIKKFGKKDSSDVIADEIDKIVKAGRGLL